MSRICAVCGSGFSRELLIVTRNWKSSRLKLLTQGCRSP
jgi:hypothetical protein